MNSNIEQSAARPDRLLVLGTGGTIAGRAAQRGDHVGYRAGEVAVADLLAGIPVPAGWRVQAEQLAQIDSKDIGPGVWRQLLVRVRELLEQPDVAGLVITHGTDTLEETAYLLQRLLAPAKPVVLTCAMRPATALVPDGPQNLADALVVAAEPGARGVLAVCAGRLHSALEIRKVHHYRLDAFDSGDAGPLGLVEQGACIRFQPWSAADAPESGRRQAWLERLLDQQPWPRVECLYSHGGADGWLVRALLAQEEVQGRQRPDRLQGLVVAGTGNGTLHADLQAALLEAQAAGLRVWRSTRCASGRVLSTATRPDPIPAVALPPAQARLALLLELCA